MNCLIKKGPYKTDKSHILSGKNSYLSHEQVSYTTDLSFNKSLFLILQEPTLEHIQFL